MSDINLDNSNKLLEESNNKIKQFVAYVCKLYTKIRWKKVFLIIPTTPKPSKRPRLSGYRIYVPGAAKNAAFFEKNVLPLMNGLFITTPCKVKLDIFVETPVSFTKTRKCLAEMKFLRPWGSTGDVDNYEKAVYDMIQPNQKRGHTGILYDDSLIIEAHTRKFYSTTPRYELTIEYMHNIPDEILTVLRLNSADE